MVNLKCGCEVTEEGKFVTGDSCKIKQCQVCTVLENHHPFD